MFWNRLPGAVATLELSLLGATLACPASAPAVPILWGPTLNLG